MRLNWLMDAPCSPRWLSLMQTAADCALWREGVDKPCAVNVRLCDDEAIRTLNAAQRGIDRATDVLSFPTVNYPAGTARDHAALIRREYDPETGLCFLGDIIISIDRAREQAQEYGHSLARELGYLTAHALLHLCGYDHMTDEDKAMMTRVREAYEKRVRVGCTGCEYCQPCPMGVKIPRIFQGIDSASMFGDAKDFAPRRGSHA